MATPHEYASMLLDVICHMGISVDTPMPVATFRSAWRLELGSNNGFEEGMKRLVDEGYVKQRETPNFYSLTEFGFSTIQEKKENKKSAAG